MSELPQCHYCTRALTPEVFSWDHVVPRCRGGANVASNRVPACKRCNNRKSCLTGEEYLAVMHCNQDRKALITEVLKELANQSDQRGDSGLPPLKSCASSLIHRETPELEWNGRDPGRSPDSRPSGRS